ncbi:MAG: cation:proton antiporter [Cyclobacteriaceae bacterium]
MLLASIQSDPLILKFVLIALGVILIGLLLRAIKQTEVIIYITTGVILGPHVMGLVEDTDQIASLGSIGLVLLLFFIGMEISLSKLIANWKISVIGTLFQVLFSILGVWGLGSFLDWGLVRIITIGFVLSLSSTAVIVKLLQESGDINKPIGQHVLGILLVQDILIVPMLISLSYMSGDGVVLIDVVKQIVGALFIAGLLGYLVIKGEVKLPFHRIIRDNHETQVFLALAICFGCSAITGFLGLSTALGAFIGGIVIASSKSTKWFHDSLFPLKVIFVALFFISVGMLIDLKFLFENFLIVAALVVLVFVINNVINSLIMRSFQVGWSDSLYGGA